MKYNIEEQSKIRFNNLFYIMEHILKKRENFNIEDLKTYYCKLKKKEQRRMGLATLPILGPATINNIVYSPLTAKNITKLAQFMKKCDLTYIDITIYEKLKNEKEEIYNQYFKEIYEKEIETLNNEIDAFDSLFKSNLEE